MARGFARVTLAGGASPAPTADKFRAISNLKFQISDDGKIQLLRRMSGAGFRGVVARVGLVS